jgi:hypothetical protein
MVIAADGGVRFGDRYWTPSYLPRRTMIEVVARQRRIPLTRTPRRAVASMPGWLIEIDGGRPCDR